MKIANAPCKRYLDVLLIDGKAQVEELELAVVSVQQVPASGAVLAGAPHVLPEAVQSGALLCISLRVVAIRILYVVLQRMHPVDLVGGLKRHRYHGHLGHLWLRGRRMRDTKLAAGRRPVGFVGECSAQGDVAGSFFGQAHNGGKVGLWV